MAWLCGLLCRIKPFGGISLGGMSSYPQLYPHIPPDCNTLNCTAMDGKKARTLVLTGVTGLICTTKNNTLVETGAIKLIGKTFAPQQSNFFHIQSYPQSYPQSNDAATKNPTLGRAFDYSANRRIKWPKHLSCLGLAASLSGRVLIMC